MTGGPTISSDDATELLEREHELAALGRCLGEVRAELHGRLLFVGGEAGGGKTALLRRFCDEHATSTRVLWGACDALFTPRPLGPFLDVAQLTGGELKVAVESGAMPYNVTTVLIREL